MAEAAINGVTKSVSSLWNMASGMFLIFLLVNYPRQRLGGGGGQQACIHPGEHGVRYVPTMSAPESAVSGGHKAILENMASGMFLLFLLMNYHRQRRSGYGGSPSLYPYWRTWRQLCSYYFCLWIIRGSGYWGSPSLYPSWRTWRQLCSYYFCLWIIIGSAAAVMVGHLACIHPGEHGVSYVPTIFACELSEAALIGGHLACIHPGEHGLRFVPTIFAPEAAVSRGSPSLYPSRRRWRQVCSYYFC